MNSNKNTEENRIYFLPKANQDIQSIYDYYWNNDLMEELYRLEEDLNHHFRRILKYPNVYPRFDQKDNTHEDVRKSVMGSYLIIYLFLQARSIVVIIRVVHSKIKDRYTLSLNVSDFMCR
jgi:plasmid stabilization system protein ParE